MKKNIFKKFIVLFSLGFILLGYNFVFAEEIPAPLECVSPQILNEIGDACVDPVVPDPTPILTLSSISITTPATKLAYIVNDTLDVTGLVVTGTYSDGSTQIEIVTSDKITGFDSTVAVTDQVLTITVGTQTTTYNISIKTAPPISNPTPIVTPKNIAVKDGCIVKDTKGVSHIFPEENSTSKFLGICALVSAQEAGYIDNFELTYDSSLGLYISSINDEKPSSTEYWALFLNGEYASCGIGCLPLSVNDKLSFVLSDWMAGTESTKILFKISSLINTTSGHTSNNSGGSNNIVVIENKTFSIQNALDFLFQNQKDSSFYMDWVAIAAGAGDNSILKTNVSDHLRFNPINSNIITDYERRAMALMALGINPYNGTSIDYIKKITDSFDGAQFGDVALINDDIFALIPLAKSGYTTNDEIIIKDINFILSKENSDGSWEGSVDLTSATIQALKPFDSAPGVSDALLKAGLFIKNKQEDNGGWGNVSSSSWATQAMNALGEVWTKNEKTTTDYFNAQQEITGEVLPVSQSIENRIWTTAYAIPAVLKLSWNDILISFPKQKDDENKIVINKEEKLPKTQIISKGKIYPKVTLSEKTSDNLQEAKVVELSQSSNNTFFTATHNVLSKIATPFVWLWVHLGF